MAGLPNKRIKLARSRLYVEGRSVDARSLSAVRSVWPAWGRRYREKEGSRDNTDR
jgi:hypothetical protein